MKRIISATLIILMTISIFGVAVSQPEETGTVTAGVTEQITPKIDSVEIIQEEVDTTEEPSISEEEFAAAMERLVFAENMQRLSEAAEESVETDKMSESVEEPVEVVQEEVVSDAGAEKVRATFFTDSRTATGLPHYGTIAGRRCDLGKTVSLYSMDWQYLGEYTFEDVGYGPNGGIVKGTCIDIWFPSEEEGWEFERDYGDYVYMVGR